MQHSKFTYAMRRSSPNPVADRMNATRVSVRTRARRVSLPYFPSIQGTRTRKRARNMQKIETNNANPVRPAVRIC